MNQDFKARMLRHLDRLFKLNKKPLKSHEESWEQKRLIDEISSFLVKGGYHSLEDFFSKAYPANIDAIASKSVYSNDISNSAKTSEHSQKNQPNSPIVREAVSKLSRYLMAFSNIIYQVQNACAEIGQCVSLGYEMNNKPHRKKSHKNKTSYNFDLGLRYLDEYKSLAKKWKL